MTEKHYIKIVEWSDEDDAFVGQCPGVIGPCCHGSDEAEVYRQLCEIVSEWLELAERDGTPLPPATAGIGAAQKIADSLSIVSPAKTARHERERLNPSDR